MRPSNARKERNVSYPGSSSIFLTPSPNIHLSSSLPASSHNSYPHPLCPFLSQSTSQPHPIPFQLDQTASWAQQGVIQNIRPSGRHVLIKHLILGFNQTKNIEQNTGESEILWPLWHEMTHVILCTLLALNTINLWTQQEARSAGTIEKQWNSSPVEPLDTNESIALFHMQHGDGTWVQAVKNLLHIVAISRLLNGYCHISLLRPFQKSSLQVKSTHGLLIYCIRAGRCRF